MRLHQLVSTVDLTRAVKDGHVAVREHPSLPLRIYCYTKLAQVKQEWNPVTRALRGVIAGHDGTIVARPFPKFFNYGDPNCGHLRLGAHVEVTDKMDGSLGILYPAGYARHAIATKGSFTSAQAKHGTDLWNRKYSPAGATPWTPPPGWTPLFEIVAPVSRVVLDYGDTDDLVLLGAVHIASGMQVGPNSPILDGWPGPRTQVLPFGTLRAALDAAPRSNAEGMVVRYVDTDQQVKIKQADYLQLHAVLTGLNRRRVWEVLVVDRFRGQVTRPQAWASFLGISHERAAELAAEPAGLLDRIAEVTPDEFHTWLFRTAGELTAAAAGLVADGLATLDNARGRARSRAELAALLRHHPLCTPLLRHADRIPAGATCWDDDPSLAMCAWKHVAPSGERAQATFTVDEDAA